MAEDHRLNEDLPSWQGTAIGIDINVDDTAEFSSLIRLISKSYSIDVRARKKFYYKKIQFT